MELNLRMLRAFLAVVEDGTFTGAALKLGVSQPALSRTVAALESEIDAQLLIRGPRLVELTEAGRRALPIAQRLLAEADALASVAERETVLRLGYAWAALGEHTSSLERNWQRAHPEVELRLINLMTPTGGVIEGQADLSVVRGPVDDPRLAAVVIGHERRYGAMSRHDPLARRRTVRLADFEGRAVAFEPETGTTKPELWASAATAPRMYTVHGMQEWLQAVAAGRALGLTTEAAVWQFPHGDIRYRPVADLPDIALHLVWHRSAPPLLLDELIATLRTTLASDARRPGSRRS